MKRLFFFLVALAICGCDNAPVEPTPHVIAFGPSSLGIVVAASTAPISDRVGHSFRVPLVIDLANVPRVNVASLDLTLVWTLPVGFDSVTNVAPGWFSYAVQVDSTRTRLVAAAAIGAVDSITPLVLWFTAPRAANGTITVSPSIVANELGEDLTAIARGRSTAVRIRR